MSLTGECEPHQLLANYPRHHANCSWRQPCCLDAGCHGRWNFRGFGCRFCILLWGKQLAARCWSQSWQRRRHQTGQCQEDRVQRHFRCQHTHTDEPVHEQGFQKLLENSIVQCYKIDHRLRRGFPVRKRLLAIWAWGFCPSQFSSGSDIHDHFVHGLHLCNECAASNGRRASRLLPWARSKHVPCQD